MRSLLNEYAALDEAKGRIQSTTAATRMTGPRIVVEVPRPDGSKYVGQIEFDPNGMTHSKHLSGFEKGDHGRQQIASKMAKQYMKDNPGKLAFGRRRGSF